MDPGWRAPSAGPCSRPCRRGSGRRTRPGPGGKPKVAGCPQGRPRRRAPTPRGELARLVAAPGRRHAGG
eukprot:2060358-Lingulodinium_polyedra.AAC.1